MPDASGAFKGIAIPCVPWHVCEDFAGHEWLPAGGGLLICRRCEAERWEDTQVRGTEAL